MTSKMPVIPRKIQIKITLSELLQKTHLEKCSSGAPDSEKSSPQSKLFSVGLLRQEFYTYQSDFILGIVIP